ncbi:MAG: CoA pyrophosphatase [Betaproteobacteria bacterium]|nr:CoA pyrophosphatase [Betaproteobacteria bacterium]
MVVSTLPAFDPRTVPVLAVTDPMPNVPPERLHAQALRARFAAAPRWQPELVREPQFSDRAQAAAVLLPLVLRSAVPTVLLTQRTTHLPTHAGQIAFPGGKMDPDDSSAQATALREAHEEVGLHPRHVEVIGELPVYVTGSGFHVTPVVALVQPPFELHPNPGEVDAVFEVPLDFLMNPAHHRRHALSWQGHQRQWFSMPYLETLPQCASPVERFIWGATAGMLRNFYRFLLAEEASAAQEMP